ncbi:MAG TPA: glycosyltransferase family 2 protein [Candidatus Dormibacteraeota bacterium]|nr:glycosyltransferase family 2 protein [Candidatus Dormibacteraeota bacterium]
MSRIAPSMDVSAVMPAFNEQANLEQSVGRTADALAAHARTFEIIVVDDGSRDDTPALLERLKATHPNLRVVRHPVNRGYGAAVRSGFDAARLPWVFLMDADNQFDPDEVALLLARAAEADIVAGYRRHRRDPLPRRLNAWAFFTLVRLLFGRLVRDVNCAFKLIRRDLLAQMDLRAEGALINTELLVLARQLHARVVEVPVHHYPRRSGKQTGANLRVVLRAFAELFAFRAQMRKVEKAA